MIATLTLAVLLAGGQGLPPNLPSFSGEIPRSVDGGAYHLAIYKESAFDAGAQFLQQAPSAPEFVAAKGEWIQKPVTLKSLKGKVVLVDFWAYTCVNCIRTFPYMKEWYKRYQNKGLEIVAVHRPEFDFEGERKNVLAATKRFGFTFPVLNDRSSTNWDNYNIEAWPTKLLVDGKGKIVYEHVGEGEYDVVEREIQKQLAIANPNFKPIAVMKPVRPTDAPGAVCHPCTLEVFAARKATGHFTEAQRNKKSLFKYPAKKVKGVYFDGFWTTTRQYAQAEANAGFSFQYMAKDVNSVLHPTAGPVTAVIYQDGRPLKTDALGDDVKMVKGMPTVKIVEPRMYNLIKNPKWGMHEFEVRFKNAGVRFHTLSFGTDCRVLGKK
jgi:thiol-disulfide isomerase/thioredoxin